MRFFKEHKLISVLLVVIVVTLVLLISSVATGGRGNFVTEGINTAIKTVTSPFYKAGSKTSLWISRIGGYGDVVKENDRLKKENQKLKESLKDQQLSEEKLKELKDLSEALNYVDASQNQKYVTGNIVSSDSTEWLHLFTIDIGKNSGIKEGSIVVAKGGLVGKVKEVGVNWAKVTTILDQENKISFSLSSDHDQLGVIDHVNNGKLSGFMINNQTSVAIGDKILTSGMGVFPGGIDIGTVNKVKVDKDKQLNVLIVKPAVDFNSLRRVTVII